MAVYKGRGVATLGGNDVGNASDLKILTTTQEVSRYAFSAPYTEGGETHVAQRVRSVFVELTLHEYTAANLADALRESAGNALEGVPAVQTLTYAGFNVTDGCAAATLNVPRLWVIPSPEIPLITDDLVSFVLRGRVIYQSGANPEWYKLTLS